MHGVPTGLSPQLPSHWDDAGSLGVKGHKNDHTRVVAMNDIRDGHETATGTRVWFVTTDRFWFVTVVLSRSTAAWFVTAMRGLMCSVTSDRFCLATASGTSIWFVTTDKIVVLIRHSHGDNLVHQNR